MQVAYLINQYPKVSHSFIRREILALEETGITVHRFAIRSLASELVDPADQAECDRTRYVLAVGKLGLLRNLLRTALTRPGRFLQALRLTIQVGWSSERGILRHLAYLAEACVLRGWWQQDAIDHVHVHFGTNSATVAMLCQVLGGPTYSLTIHGPEEFDKVPAIALPEKIARAAFVVAISSFGRSQLYRWCDYRAWPKIHVVRCGVDALFLAQPTTPIPSQQTLVCVGRLSEQKGHLLLMQAFRQVVAEGLSCKLVLVGDGPLRGEIEALIAEAGLQDRVEITGWASNTVVRQWLLQSQALVLPSFAEGLPVVIMEALALARPVLSTYIAGIPELVTPGECGWLVPAGSVEALVAALRQLLQTPTAELEAMGQRGKERVAQQHDINQEAAKLAELLHKYRA